jgi:tRNA pseudouridine55 synthase
MILNIYKPKDWTSFDVVAKLRGILGTKKIGHAGTLDPLAEGVLLILTDQDTKKQQELMSEDKEYLATIAFGAESETYDLEKTPKLIKDNLDTKEIEFELLKILPNYIGEIDQQVPAYSAVKVKGKPLYKQARQGNFAATDLPTKKVTIYGIEIEDTSSEELETPSGAAWLPTITLTITCGCGTYIRSLAHDLGKDLKTGAILTNLIRTRVGDYKVEDAKTLESLAEQLHTDSSEIPSS